ncbi:TetR family transcriptional regulator [Methylocapsa acidiphila]|uniref:TetR family transcriptional regulator n=1 Tax=Methylocapsa acidiphila TaxID=133552 RepID=UPI0012EB2B45|nr:TetR family transcriptional regulator [Methylocapsa acidiphila]
MKTTIGNADDIIAVAAVLFTEIGYRTTSLSDISDRCLIGTCKQSELFKDKEALALEVLAAAQLRLDTLVFCHAYSNTTVIQSKLVEMYNASRLLFVNDKSNYVFVTFIIENLHRVSPFATPINNYIDSCNAAYYAVFSAIYADVKAQSLACDFVSDLQGALIMMRVSGSVEPLRQLFKRSLRMLDKTSGKLNAHDKNPAW